MNKPKIFCVYIGPCAIGNYAGLALTKDGEVLATTVAQSAKVFCHMLGLGRSKRNHDVYDKRFPGGWELVCEPESDESESAWETYLNKMPQEEPKP